MIGVYILGPYTINDTVSIIINTNNIIDHLKLRLIEYRLDFLIFEHNII